MVESPNSLVQDHNRIWFLYGKTKQVLLLPGFQFLHPSDLQMVRTCHIPQFLLISTNKLLMKYENWKIIYFTHQWFCGAPVVLALNPAYVVPFTVFPITSCELIYWQEMSWSYRKFDTSCKIWFHCSEDETGEWENDFFNFKLACKKSGSFETTAAVKCACILSKAFNTRGSWSCLYSVTI